MTSAASARASSTRPRCARFAASSRRPSAGFCMRWTVATTDRQPRGGFMRGTRVGRIVRRIAVTIAGGIVIAFGIVLLPLPGPGWLVIFGGLGILGTEYEWARRLLLQVRRLVTRWTKWLAAKPLRRRCCDA